MCVCLCVCLFRCIWLATPSLRSEAGVSGRQPSLMEFDKLRTIRASIAKKEEQVKHFEEELRLQKRKIDENGSQRESKADAKHKSEKAALTDKISSKLLQIETTQKKIEMYQKNNAKLTSQIASSKGSSKIARLKQGIHDKEAEIKFLREDNRRLEKSQRALTKQLQQQQKDQEGWPQKIQTLLTDVKVLQDRLAREAKRESKAEASTSRQSQEMKAALALNAKLREQLAVFGHDDLISELRKAKQAKLQDWKQREESLTTDIEELRAELEEKKRTIGHKLREKTRQIQSVKDEVTASEEELKNKQRATKNTQYQIKKLKRELKQLIATGGGAYLQQIREAETKEEGEEDGAGSRRSDATKQERQLQQDQRKGNSVADRRISVRSNSSGSNNDDDNDNTSPKSISSSNDGGGGVSSSSSSKQQAASVSNMGAAAVTFESFRSLLAQTGQQVDEARAAVIFESYSAKFPASQQNIGTLLSFLLSGAVVAAQAASSSSSGSGGGSSSSGSSSGGGSSGDSSKSSSSDNGVGVTTANSGVAEAAAKNNPGDEGDGAHPAHADGDANAGADGQNGADASADTGADASGGGTGADASADADADAEAADGDAADAGARAATADTKVETGSDANDAAADDAGGTEGADGTASHP